MNMNTKSSPVSGFSLFELCVAMALVVVLALLSVSAVRSTRERSNAMKCVGNLRQWGALINLYTVDHQGFFPMNQTPRESGGKKLFFEDLARYGEYRYPLGDTAANRELYRRTLLACPSEETLGKSIPFCYALNIDLDFTVQGPVARVNQRTLTNAATYVLMSDSYKTSTFYSYKRERFEDYSNCHRRHGGIPNFLYADGHVAPFRQEMIGWGDVGGNTEENRLRWFANGMNPTKR